MFPGDQSWQIQCCRKDYLALSCPKKRPYCCFILCFETSRVEKYKCRCVYIFVCRGIYPCHVLFVDQLTAGLEAVCPDPRVVIWET